MMHHRILSFLACAALCMTAAVPRASAQDGEPLTEWTAEKKIVAKLGEEFTD
jgi:hypothetical protein